MESGHGSRLGENEICKRGRQLVGTGKPVVRGDPLQGGVDGTRGVMKRGTDKDNAEIRGVFSQNPRGFVQKRGLRKIWAYETA